MKDREEKIIVESGPPQFSESIFYRLYKNEKSNFFIIREIDEAKISDKITLPRRRLTMPEIMHMRKPCATCIKTNQECPDRKEAIVMCIGDKDPINPWEYIQNITASAIQAGKAISVSAKKAAEACEALKKACANINLGEPYEEKNNAEKG